MICEKKRIAAVVLAAGCSSRMTGQHKLLAEICGRPMLCHVIDGIVEAEIPEIIVVTGHNHGAVEELLADCRGLRIIHNPAYRQGLSSSIARGLKALGPEFEGALVCLGDMPLLRGRHLLRICSFFSADDVICVPYFNGQQGNPVLWGRKFFPELMNLQGDKGGRVLFQRYQDRVVAVEMADRAVLTDVDSLTDLDSIANDFAV